MSQAQDKVTTTTEEPVQTGDIVAEVTENQLFVRLGNVFMPKNIHADASYSTYPLSYDHNPFFHSASDPMLTLAKGVVTIMGRSGMSKSSLARYISRHFNYEYCEFFEPTPTSSTSLTQLVTKLISFIEDPSLEGIVIDSFKALVYLPGATGKGGVNMSALQQLSNLSAVAARHNKTIVAVFNLTTDDEVVYANYLEAMIGSVNGVFSLNAPGQAAVRLRNLETGERPSFSFKWAKEDNVAKLHNAAVPMDVLSSKIPDFADVMGNASNALNFYKGE